MNSSSSDLGNPRILCSFHICIVCIYKYNYLILFMYIYIFLYILYISCDIYMLNLNAFPQMLNMVKLGVEHAFSMLR